MKVWHLDRAAAGVKAQLQPALRHYHLPAFLSRAPLVVALAGGTGRAALGNGLGGGAKGNL